MRHPGDSGGVTAASRAVVARRVRGEVLRGADVPAGAAPARGRAA
ncbi:hypothetical protein STTU_4447 [Streptomyces sp. Tu6071]|nr:hypothetical protein STTU_4447 [Streptomyces sp. Tu6071]